MASAIAESSKVVSPIRKRTASEGIIMFRKKIKIFGKIVLTLITGFFLILQSVFDGILNATMITPNQRNIPLFLYFFKHNKI